MFRRLRLRVDRDSSRLQYVPEDFWCRVGLQSLKLDLALQTQNFTTQAQRRSVVP